MSVTILDERVSALEQKVAILMEKMRSPAFEKDWRTAIGMFDDDTLMQEIDEEGRKIRNQDREQARRDTP